MAERASPSGDEYPGKMLQQAAIYNNVDFLESLLEGDEAQYINTRDMFGRTALYTSVTNNSIECGRKLLTMGANPNIACGPQCGGMTPLHAAALDDKHQFVTLLLEQGADPMIKDGSGQGALDSAEKNRSTESIEIIKEHLDWKLRKKRQTEDELYDTCLKGNVDGARSIAEKLDAESIKKVVNRIKEGQQTLLFRSCHFGRNRMVEYLLSVGADDQLHPVTAHSPLHVACREGHPHIVKMLLKAFPDLVNCQTTEGTLPFHCAAMGGHADVISMLLTFPYPDSTMQLFKEKKGDRMYRLGFHFNAPDGNGQTALHLAALYRHTEVVNLLLNFTVKVTRRFNNQYRSDEIYDNGFYGLGKTDGGVSKGFRDKDSPDCREATEDFGSEGEQSPKEEGFKPVEIDLLDLGGNTPLHLVVQLGKSTIADDIAKMLLTRGANPNKPSITASGNTTALMMACENEDVSMLNILLNNKAEDLEDKVLAKALVLRNDGLIASMLKYKTHTDSEYRINKQALVAQYFGEGAVAETYDSSNTDFQRVIPVMPTAINWHNLKLSDLRKAWLVEASFFHNQSMIRNEISLVLSLGAITRIDVSKNNITNLPPEVFMLKSLKFLDASDNRIEILPSAEPLEVFAEEPDNKEIQEEKTSPFKFFKERESAIKNIHKIQETEITSNHRIFSYDCPLLEEIELSKNCLTRLPADLFTLPLLQKLNVSHNDLEEIPFEMWTNPRSLVEVNLSHNQLQDLSCDEGRAHTSTRKDSIDSGLSKDGVFLRGDRPSGLPDISDTSGADSGSDTASVSSFQNISANNDPLIEGAAPSSPDSTYKEADISHHNHWNTKVKVKTLLLEADEEFRKNKVSQIVELNLSHNNLTKVPSGIACLVPQLNKLNLSYNKLTSIGPLNNYPANIKWLDLSHNIIEHTAIIDDEPLDTRYDAMLCFSPAYLAKINKRLQSQSLPATSPGLRSMRNGSSSSLPGIGNSNAVHSGFGMLCPHRSHTQLEKLRTLRMTNNNMYKLVLSLLDSGSIDKDSISSSGEQDSGAETKSLETKRVSILSAPGETSSQHLFFPNLSVIDLGNNALTSLPPDISEMVCLAECKVPYNKIKELPPEMGMLTKMWNLDVTGCPVEKTLQSLLGDKAKKTSAVKGYLKSIKDEAKLYNRMKLMFVGVQGIGKTSLLDHLRREGRSSNQKNRTWHERMGITGDKDFKGKNLSTVGVDIGDLVLTKGNREIIFKTWDFGGQREYYATHQYFLTKRSLYLVVWKVTKGEKGVEEILQWLVNIQARAPNAPVIIVGTHLDEINKKKYPINYIQDLHQLIKEKYMLHPEPEKCGLPRVMGVVEVGCVNKIMFSNHIKDLVNMIINVVSEERLPGNRGARLLEQKVPASYVHLSDVVSLLAEKRKREGKDPVLHTEQYRPYVMEMMETEYNHSFRDVMEMNQATQFLHENGVLLHYDDVNLQDIYFLDPQWLCDMLANVVTIREINVTAISGIMKTDDLRLLFKNTAFKPEDIKIYVIDLLNKFEVALLWDKKNLLIPSLLPTEEASLNPHIIGDVRIPLKGYPYSSDLRLERNIIKPPSGTQQQIGKSTFYPETVETPIFDSNSNDSPITEDNLPQVTSDPNPAVALVRLYLMSYFPSGFWPRLITRLLGDAGFYEIVRDLYKVPENLSNQAWLKKQRYNMEWKCWQTGLELKFLGVTMLRIKESMQDKPNMFCDYRQCQMVIKHESEHSWVQLNILNTSILEILIPNETLILHAEDDISKGRYSEGETQDTKQVLQPNSQMAAALLAKVVDHIDTLLEDWYPDLGARFIQNSKGMYLITRIVPCMHCLLHQIQLQNTAAESKDAWTIVDINPAVSPTQSSNPLAITNRQVVLGGQVSGSVDETKAGGGSPCDFGLSESAPAQSQSATVNNLMGMDAVRTIYNKTSELTGGVLPRWDSDGNGERKTISSEKKQTKVYCYLIEQCLQAAQLNKVVFCPDHGNIGPYFIASFQGQVQSAHVAPDAVFQDIGDQNVIERDQITVGNFLGKGAFGAVFAGTIVDKRTDMRIDVAMKMLQPFNPGQRATKSQKHNYKIEKTKWDKDPTKNSCEAYLNARKELSILLALSHPNIVPLVGISLQPLCLILSLAPGGALYDKLKDYKRAGARLTPLVIQRIVIQTADALDYLHSCQIIYRDLKSENVLVWELPPPHKNDPNLPVSIKLADYGVSRSVLPSGAKGLAGTPPFIAPEIIQHNGEESYTEKVDCFSFGMFLYELLVLSLPFEGYDTGAAGGANLKGYVLAGGRPAISQKELAYPTHMLDLMTLMWSHDPNDRPSAKEIKIVAEHPEFCHLRDILSLERQVDVTAACSAITMQPDFQIPLFEDRSHSLDFHAMTTDVWVASVNEKGCNVHVLTYNNQACEVAKSTIVGIAPICCMCVAGKNVWGADRGANIHVFSRKDHREILKFQATSESNTQVETMSYSKQEKTVYLVLSNGSLITCDTEFPLNFSSTYSPVKRKCPGNRKEIFCITVLAKTSSSSILWCGQTQGKISVWDLSATEAEQPKTLVHSSADNVDKANVIYLVTSTYDNRAVWAYLYPGSVVYRWDTKTALMTNKIDVSEIIPWDDRDVLKKQNWPQMKSCRFQVTAINVLYDHLYVATTWGCILVVNKYSMKPVAIFRCHGKDAPYIKAILPLVDDNKSPTYQSPPEVSTTPSFVTIGRGYRDMITNTLNFKTGKTLTHESKFFCLSWLGEHWKHTSDKSLFKTVKSPVHTTV